MARMQNRREWTLCVRGGDIFDKWALMFIMLVCGCVYEWVLVCAVIQYGQLNTKISVLVCCFYINTKGISGSNHAACCVHQRGGRWRSAQSCIRMHYITCNSNATHKPTDIAYGGEVRGRGWERATSHGQERRLNCSTHNPYASRLRRVHKFAQKHCWTSENNR